MKTLIKTTMAAVISSGLILGAVAVPTAASARQSYVCQVEKKENAQKGMIIGAIAGGLLGSQVSKNERGLGAVGGAVIGGVLGRSLGEDKGKSNCKKIEAQARETYGNRRVDRYHSYDDRRYDRGYAYGYR
ncbi:hypothetical protein ABAC460_08490 [Asticcacaulis sp. AC460]|uniref:glycine zipper 2TM domain-containing protein n=1 Tax=Asticcacaulis sp. AC460 TaxID=1282360 RepID=UPI0003C3B97B|nr:glycine zipper 2TM domain-containing protein [Asticcacaulis sp. AC460]ESQ90856.1 hypothetical protein ABAC460_08490 [Asticcacaulis sp. AC460]